MLRSFVKSFKESLCCAVIILQAGCATVAPHQAGAPVEADSEGASRLWHAAAKFETGLEKMGLVYDDPGVTRYVQSVYDRLYPDFADSTHVKILRNPSLNAFALPNGGIYVHSGLLATLENEAQLASVLAHEGVHFLHKHSERYRQDSNVAVGITLSAAMLGFPFPELFFYGCMAGYSRSLEREADSVGLDHYLEHGYAASEAQNAFVALEREARLQEDSNKVPYFLSSHPKLRERIANYRAMTEGKPSAGDIGAEQYQQHIRAIWVPVLEDKLSAGQYASLIALAEQRKFEHEFGAENAFYAAEALRLRKKEGDLEKANRYYRQSITHNPQYAPPYRALGILSYKNKDFVGAAEYFERYLALAPEEPEAAFVKQYLDTITTRAKP